MVIYTSLFGATLALVSINPSFAEAMGVDFWHLGQLQQQLETAQDRDRVLDVQRETVMAHFEQNAAICQALYDGRRALPETAKLMLQLNGHRADYMYNIRVLRSGPTLEARMACNLLCLVRELERDYPTRPSPLPELCRQYELAYGTRPAIDR
jgi:hypothetical protein